MLTCYPGEIININYLDTIFACRLLRIISVGCPIKINNDRIYFEFFSTWQHRGKRICIRNVQKYLNIKIYCIWIVYANQKIKKGNKWKRLMFRKDKSNKHWSVLTSKIQICNKLEIREISHFVTLMAHPVCIFIGW